MPAFLQPYTTVLYDTRLSWHGFKFPPRPVEVIKVGKKRVKVYLDGRDQWVTPRHLFPAQGGRRVH